MSIFINNLLLFIDKKKYKHSFIARQAKIDMNRFNELINLEDSITLDEMEKISSGLGKRVSFFYDSNFKENVGKIHSLGAYYYLEQDDLDQDLKEFTYDIYRLCRNFSHIVGFKDWMMKQYEYESGEGFRKLNNKK